MSEIYVRFTTHHEIGNRENWGNVSHCCSLCKADLDLNNAFLGHKDNCDYHKIFELQEENKALHSEVSRLIDEVGNRDDVIEMLGNKLQHDVQNEIDGLNDIVKKRDATIREMRFEIDKLVDLLNKKDK